ncbi:MAG: carboxypeptidase-like regulatory domain-containing protein, partial [Candidatus Zixiibacteriota bacterium]
FWGIVYIQSGQTVPGVTVTLFFPDGSQEEDVTNKYGEYRFCRPLGGWVPGYYLIATEKCCEKWVYRAGAGNIQTNFVMPCKCR